MIGYKGQLSFLQYMLKKPQKWGMKAWALARLKHRIYLELKLYTGKDDDAEQGKSLGERVVTKNLWHKGYHLYCDNFCTSPSLCSKLFDYGMGTCGTVRLNRRGIPKPFQAQKLKRGEIASFQNGVINGMKWMDKRPLAVLSTIHDISMSTISRRNRLACGGIEAVQKPSMIVDYNTFMGGVDKADQLVTYYGFSHHSKKWGKCAIRPLTRYHHSECIPIVLRATSQWLTHVDFRLSVAMTLMRKVNYHLLLCLSIRRMQHIYLPVSLVKSTFLSQEVNGMFTTRSR